MSLRSFVARLLRRPSPQPARAFVVLTAPCVVRFFRRRYSAESLPPPGRVCPAGTVFEVVKVPEAERRLGRLDLFGLPDGGQVGIQQGLWAWVTVPGPRLLAPDARPRLLRLKRPGTVWEARAYGDGTMFEVFEFPTGFQKDRGLDVFASGEDAATLGFEPGTWEWADEG